MLQKEQVGVLNTITRGWGFVAVIRTSDDDFHRPEGLNTTTEIAQETFSHVC
jgi:hypothetical protein